MNREEVAQKMAAEWLAAHPGATVEHVAGWISACGCLGCPQWGVRSGLGPYDYSCECGAKCRCRCTLEPYKSQNAAKWEWALGQAELAVVRASAVKS
jgi:hypothetical protein